MNSNYDVAFDLTIGHEGGYQNDRRDRGNWTTGRIGRGELRGTKFGVSAMSYPHLDIKNLTLKDAKSIYFVDYWVKAKCDQLPSGLDYLVFDAAVNHGITRAIKLLQATVGTYEDGIVGPVTLGQVQRSHTANPLGVQEEYSVQRAMFFTKIRTFPTYGLGWIRRAFGTLVHSLAIAEKAHS